MLKEIKLDQSLFTLLDQYPDLIDVLYDFGFTQIKLPGMIQSAGRFMTLRKGCEMRKLDIGVLVNMLNKLGYTIKESQ
ncbi:MAG TPA: DUF1858 domain-containing protein [Erysipelotrichaceae bacterium]|nr:DUF1858 domain-containing protein [Erysipelotrichaceae bacterium]